MLDFHTHILPGIDDGSKSSQMSCDMINELIKQGVDAFVATPHFYYDCMSIEGFLKHRKISSMRILDALEKNGIKERPKFVLGAEVKFFYGLDAFEAADLLCISGTRYMLVEMPFKVWDKKMYSTLTSLYMNRGIIPIIAHIERYLTSNPGNGMLRNIVRTGALVQANTAFFTSFRTRLKAFTMMKNGLIQFVGTDCHDMEKRKPEFSKAMELFEKKANGLYLNDLKFWENKFEEEKPEWI